MNFVNNEFKQGFVDPVLVVLAPPAPHAPFLPASRYKDTFPDVKSKLTPNFNVLPKVILKPAQFHFVFFMFFLKYFNLIE